MSDQTNGKKIGSTPEASNGSKKPSNGNGKKNGNSTKDEPQPLVPVDGFELGGAKRKHLESLIRHIKLVQEATQLLGFRLLEHAQTEGEVKFAIKLMARGLRHDHSKFNGIEWEHLTRSESQEEMLAKSYHQHVTTNEHHPENWGGLSEMPTICLAEMACDIYARSSEMGTDIRVFVKETIPKKYSVSKSTKAYKTLRRFIELLLDEPFGTIKN